MSHIEIHEPSSLSAHELIDPLFAEIVGSPFEWVCDHEVDAPERHGRVDEYCHEDDTATESWFVVHGDHFFPCRKDARVSTPEMAVRRMLASLRS